MPFDDSAIKEVQRLLVDSLWVKVPTRILKLVQITAPHFVAALYAEDGHVVTTDPILRYMQGWDGKRLADYCRKKGWEWEVIQTVEE